MRGVAVGKSSPGFVRRLAGITYSIWLNGLPGSEEGVLRMGWTLEIWWGGLEGGVYFILLFVLWKETGWWSVVMRKLRKLHFTLTLPATLNLLNSPEAVLVDAQTFVCKFYFVLKTQPETIYTIEQSITQYFERTVNVSLGFSCIYCVLNFVSISKHFWTRQSPNSIYLCKLQYMRVFTGLDGSKIITVLYKM